MTISVSRRVHERREMITRVDQQSRLDVPKNESSSGLPCLSVDFGNG